MEAKPKFSIELTTKDEYECFELPSPLTPSMLVFGVPLDARETKLWNVIKNPGDRLDLFYDQGVPWHVRTAVKKIFTVDNLKKRDLPRVLEGEGYGIVKGCGGVAGLKKVVEAFKTKKGKLYEHYRKQLNEDDFDITSFNIEEMNQVIFYSPLVYKIFYEPDLFD
jgi:hypothetical protein